MGDRQTLVTPPLPRARLESQLQTRWCRRGAAIIQTQLATIHEMMATRALPYLTADLPGVGGRIRSENADFEVEEIPAYEPSGSGEHLYLWMEKTGLGAEYFERQIAKRLNIPTAEIGIAGLKDRHAVTRQWVSVPVRCEPLLTALDGDGMRVLQTTRHTNKLKTGHLRGNRFRILIRDASATDPTPLLERIRTLGLPNFYGPQRFGHNNETALLGFAMLRKEPCKVRNPFLRKLALSAAQAWLFNDCLAQRMADGLFRHVLLGDVMAKWPAGGMFNVTDVATEQQRFDAREIVTTGPIFGKKTFAAKDDAAIRESTVLAASGLPEDAFDGFGKLVMGTRRHNLVYIDDLDASREDVGLRLTFTLPSGSYATTLLREIMKTDIVGDEE